MTGPPWNLTIATAAYGPAGELTSLNGDTRTYNTLGQLTRISGGGIDLEYVYTAGQNNGRITQQIDHISGEQVTYQYDQLNRLSHAETLDNSWGLSYGYDGFGNLTAKTVTKGTAIPGWTGFTVAYDPATNHGDAYDANGNASVGGVYPYDVENRLTATIRSPAQGEYYGSDGSYVYDPWGKRVGWRFPRSTGIAGSDPETKCEVHFYGITGQKLASYSCGYHDAEGGDGTFYWSLKGYNVYFAGHLVQSNGVSVTTDRLGSVRANGSGERFNYLPNGEERTPTADGREKFATYIRDSGGLDYADQRYYDRGSGRFLTADPGGISTADVQHAGPVDADQRRRDRPGVRLHGRAEQRPDHAADRPRERRAGDLPVRPVEPAVARRDAGQQLGAVVRLRRFREPDGEDGDEPTPTSSHTASRHPCY